MQAMFKVIAFCDARYLDVTRQAAGEHAKVMVSPPVLDVNVQELPLSFFAVDLVYFNFHAMPGQEAWINTNGDVALSAQTLIQFDLRPAVVFMVNCYAGGGMLDALRATKPRAIVGGEGENLGGVKTLAGADRLGLWFRRGLEMGLSPDRALRLAKAMLRVGVNTKSVADALEFKLL
jgi:hypothetical protein